MLVRNNSWFLGYLYPKPKPCGTLKKKENRDSMSNLEIGDIMYINYIEYYI